MIGDIHLFQRALHKDKWDREGRNDESRWAVTTPEKHNLRGE